MLVSALSFARGGAALGATGPTLPRSVWAGLLFCLVLGGVLASSVALTLRRRRELERVALAIESAGVGIWDWDVVNDRLVRDNRTYRPLGIAADRFAGAYEACRSRLHPEDREKWNAEIRSALKDKKEFDIEFRAIWPDMSIHHIRCHAVVRRDASGKALRMVGVDFDISAQKRAEASMLSAYRELEEAKSKTEGLMREAQAANSAKGNFLATMSHEIRTPMSGIIGVSRLLMDTELGPEQRKYAQVLINSGEALLAIVNDILDFSKIEAGKLELEYLDFHLRVVVEDSMDIIAIAAREKGLRVMSFIDPDVDVHLRGDPGRLRQILINLLGNAVKFTPSGSVALRTSLESDYGGRTTLRFSVTDTGIGIPPERRAALFSPFAQADGAIARKYGGSGLGLSISKQLAELMGGRIGAESKEGAGSTFWFTAVFEKRSAGILSDPPASTNLSGIRLLVADGYETNRLLLESFLSSWGCRFDAAADGHAALSLLAKAALEGDPYTVALLDMDMPGMEGVELVRRIKANPDLRDPRIVMMASKEDPAYAARLAAFGISAFLAKPARQSRLYDCLASIAQDAMRSGESGFDSKEPARNAVSESRARDYRILLAEDNATNQLIALTILEKLRYRVDVAADGKEAVDALQRAPYDLVLMDCQMPNMDGYEATRSIRISELGGGRVPIIAMTADAMKGDRERCLDAGMDDYLSKPVKPAELVMKLEKWLAPIEEELEELEALPEEEGSGSPAGTLPVFDEAAFMARAMGDASLARTLIRMFIQDTPAKVAKISAAVSDGDFLLAAQLAHLIKGAAANLSCKALREAAAEMEAAGAAEDLVTLERLSPELRLRFSELMEALERRGGEAMVKEST
jgi:signal transduction histidine kinase/DNA-binding response OmpR family regulator/HPt (histidine-containing phosphotransfer) domain-containing protein